jgi:hypothetical protein
MAESAVDSSFSEVLSKVTGKLLVGGHLTLADQNGDSAISLSRFEATDLEYRRWSIEYVFDGKVLATTQYRIYALAPDRPPPPEVTFITGTISGRSGCAEMLGA